MTVKRALASFLTLLMLALPLALPALGQDGGAAGRFDVGEHTFSAYTSGAENGTRDFTFDHDDVVYIVVAPQVSPPGNYTGNFTVLGLPDGNASGRDTCVGQDGDCVPLRGPVAVPSRPFSLGTWNETTVAQAIRSVTYRAYPEWTPGTHAVNVTVTVQSLDDPDADPVNSTFTVSFTTAAPPPIAPEPGTNWGVLLLVTAAVLLLGGGGYALLSRRRKPAAVPRSQTLQRMEMERQIERLEKRAETDQEAAAEVQALKEEARAQEMVRQKSRERMIVEAKRDDAVKSIDLLRKRRESGQLTELQFNKMMEKKTEQLHAIERELSEMDARGE